MEETENLIVSLNEELIVEILVRLPVSSLSHFKCVSKSWHSLICDSQFAKRHFDQDSASSDHVLNKERVFNGFIESNNIWDESVVSLRLPPPFRPTHLPPLLRLQFWGSCRGFVLIYYRDTYEIIIWNPSTGAQKRVQLPYSRAEIAAEGIPNSSCVFGFGYDASTDDYLVILVKPPKIMLFSVKTYSWNYTYCSLYDEKELSKEKFYISLLPGLLSNGALHWIAFSCSRLVFVVAFDLVQMRYFSEISLPPDSIKSTHLELHTIRGCLSVLGLFDKENGMNWVMKLWLMKEYKELSSWTKFFVSVIDPSSSPSCIDIHNVWTISNIFHIRLHKSDKAEGEKSASNLCCVRFEGPTGKIVTSNCCLISGETKGKINEHCENVLYTGHLQLSMYRESLLSLPLSLPSDSEKTCQDH